MRLTLQGPGNSHSAWQIADPQHLVAVVHSHSSVEIEVVAAVTVTLLLLLSSDLLFLAPPSEQVKTLPPTSCFPDNS